MYPAGFATRIVPEGPADAGLEDAFRPHFFGGVATVVAKLLIQCHARLRRVRREGLSATQGGHADGEAISICRSRSSACRRCARADGLALSSRNAYLSAGERATAPTLYRVLRQCAAAIAEASRPGAGARRRRPAIERAGFTLDYLEARNAETLEQVATSADAPLRLLVAARIGKTRLIDNIAA